MITASPRNATRHDRNVVMKPPMQRAHGGGDRGGRADHRVDAPLRVALEVAVDERLHRGQQQGRAESADDRPEDDDRQEGLGQRHGRRADRVGEEPQRVRALAADEVGGLAAEEDECGRDERLERDRRLDAADRRADVLDDGRDRHVHDRRVDHEDEHRHREQDREAPVRLRGFLRTLRDHLRHAPSSTGFACVVERPGVPMLTAARGRCPPGRPPYGRPARSALEVPPAAWCAAAPGPGSIGPAAHRDHFAMARGGPLRDPRGIPRGGPVA